jgi:hypothetical protein
MQGAGITKQFPESVASSFLDLEIVYFWDMAWFTVTQNVTYMASSFQRFSYKLES